MEIFSNIAHDKFEFKSTAPPDPNILKDEEVLVENKYLGIHASMRSWLSGLKTYKSGVQVGETMHGSTVAVVLFSKSKEYKVGELVVGMFAWETYSIAHSSNIYYKVIENYPYPQHFLSVLGNSGLTAYVGLNVIGKAKKGETVVVSAAAGGVGQIVVGLAKILGCKVVGIAGTQEKCEYVTKFLGGDHCINYKTQNIKEELEKICPEGIDVYFDNVGGETLDIILKLINNNARIAICGAVSQYSQSAEPEKVYGLKNTSQLILKRAKMEGFIYFTHKDILPGAVQEIMQYISEGRLKFKEVIFEGLEQAPKALQLVFSGENIGKVMVKI